MIKIECINSTFLKLSLKISSILVWLDEEIENNDKECEWSKKIFNLVPVEGQNNILLFWVAGIISIYNSIHQKRDILKNMMRTIINVLLLKCTI